MKPTRPILRYFGGKWRLAPWIISLMPPHRTYVEPFGGAASVLLRKERCYDEVFNDLDGDVVNLFRMARDRGEELAEAVRLTPFSRREYSEAQAVCADPLENARRLVVRSFMGFGADSCARKSGFRAVARSQRRVPAKDWTNYPEALKVVIERLRGVIIEEDNAENIIRRHDSPEALIYADPPYCHSTRTGKHNSTAACTPDGGRRDTPRSRTTPSGRSSACG